MKNKKFIIIAGMILVILSFNSCKKWIDTDLNTDPNKPKEVSYALQLPTTQTGLAYALGGDLSYAGLIWMQQLAGGAAQPLSYDHYNVTQSDVNNAWVWNLYGGPMEDLSMMIKTANSSGSPHYSGIAKVLMALALGTVTDLWGDVPYTYAWDGENNLKPLYDKQEDIYKTINALLDGAITDLGAGSSLLVPYTDDLIYGGNLTAWTKAAYSLKARYAIHLSKIKGDQAYTDALAALANGFTSNGQDLEFSFGEDYNNSNPFYQFYWWERPGDIVMAAKMVDTLFNSNDPRATVYFDTTDVGALGSLPGEGGYSCNPGAYFASSASKVSFMSYVELKFIEAEAKYMTDDKSGAATAYNDAIKASLSKYGVSDAAWEALYANDSSESITLEKIMTQKYISSFLQIETFVDWRRTGYPVLKPSADNVTGNKQPRRYPYPTSERIYNGANVPSSGPYGGVTILDRVWWDKAIVPSKK